MRPVRPPPKVVPPKPPAYLFDPSNSMEDFGRDLHIRGAPSPRPNVTGDSRDPRLKVHMAHNHYNKDPPFYPSQGPPHRTLENASPRYPAGPIPGSDRSMNRENDEPYRKGPVPQSLSSKEDFARDVEDQMKRLEEDMLKLMIESGELQAPPNHGKPPNREDSHKESYMRGYEPTSSNVPPSWSYSNTGNPAVPTKYRPPQQDNAPSGPNDHRGNAQIQQSPRITKESPRENYGNDFISQLSRGNPSPARRKGNALGHLHEADDHLRMKAEKQALYSQQLQQQMRDKASGNVRDTEKREPGGNKNQRLHEESGGLALGLDKNKEQELRRQRQLEYKMQLDKQVFLKPKEEQGGTSLSLGLDKNQEAALRRQKQLEYRQQLDQQSAVTSSKPSRHPHHYEDDSINNGRYPDRGVPDGYESRNQPSNPFSRKEVSPRYEYPPERDYSSRYHDLPPPQADYIKDKTPSKSITNPLSFEEKEHKRSKQDDYRKQLDAQKKERERQKEEEKKKLEEEERRFMAEIEASKVNSGNNQKQDMKVPHQPQPPPYSRVPAYPEDSSTRSEYAQNDRRQVSFEDPGREVDNRSDDYYLDRRRPQPRGEDVDYAYPHRDQDYYDDRRQPPRQHDRDEYSRRYHAEEEPPVLDYEKRQSSSQNYGYQPSISHTTSAELSPSKSPKPARNQLVQDIYGRKSILSHNEDNVKDAWKPSGKNNNERQRNAINDQKAALDRQKEENKRLKEEEKQKQKEDDEKLERKIRAEIAAEQEQSRLDKEKKQKLAQDNQRDIEDMQQRKEKEALARKGFSEKDKVTPSNQKSASIASYDHIQSPLKNLVGDFDRNKAPPAERDPSHRSPPRQNHRSPPGGYPPKDDCIDDFVRNYEQRKPFLESPKRSNSEYPPRNSVLEASQDYDFPPRGYDRDPHRQAHNPLHDSFRRDGGRDVIQREDSFRRDATRDYDRDYPPRGHYDYPRRDSYYRRETESYRSEEPYHNKDVPPGYGMDPTGPGASYQKYSNYSSNASMDYPRKQYDVHSSYRSDNSGFDGDRNVLRDEPTDPEISFVSESRFVPANPWSSDIVSSLLPLQSIPEHIRKTKGELSYVPPISSEIDPVNKIKVRAKGPIDLEQSLASDSLLVYVGPKTPNPGLRNPRAEPVATSPPIKSSVSATVNKEVVPLTEGDKSLVRTTSARSKTPERLDPASMPVAGRPTSRHDSIEVKRVIAQPIIPSADEVPGNRIFVNKVQNNSQPQLSPHHKNLSHRYPEPLVSSFGRDNMFASDIDLADPSLEHKQDDISSRHTTKQSWNRDVARENDFYSLDRPHSRPISSSNAHAELSSGNGKRGWDVSDESRNEIIKRLEQHIGHERPCAEEAYEESFESA